MSELTVHSLCLAATLLLFGNSPVAGQIIKGRTSFFQDVKTDVPLPLSANGSSVLRLIRKIDSVVAITPGEVYTFHQNKWESTNHPGEWLTATLDRQKNIWLASAHEIRNWNGNIKLHLPENASSDTVLCLFWKDEKNLYVGTNRHLLTWNGNWAIHPGINARVNAIETDALKNLWVATTNGLWRHSDGKWVNLDETLMAVGNERTYFSLSTKNMGNDLLIGSRWSVGCIAGDGNHWAVSGNNGLPYGPVKVIRQAENGLWLGTDKGAIRKDSAWHYFNDRRWLPDNKVNDILPVDERTIWIATPRGISQIRQVEMTLEKKADWYEQIIEKRHNRIGLINISHLKVPGDLSTSYTENEDNDGLWTACYLGAECFRYAATKDPEAKTKAIRTFEALERLETVTGIPGYPARSYARATDKVKQSRSPHPKAWHPSPDGKWQWLDDTSSDEIAGHIFTLALFHDLVADSNQKERVKKLIERTLNHIIDNQFQLIDFDGKPTRWGIWNPDSLNRSPNWMYERNLNSLQILSHLKTGIYLTGNQKFKKVYDELNEKQGYALNAIQAKVYGPFETSHSDDILNFFPYFNLFQYATDDPYFQMYIESLERSWKAVKADHMPVWNIMASALLKKDCGLQVAREELEQYPVDLVNWTMQNSHRWDIQRDMMVDRGGRQQAARPIPSPESNISRWNTNPKQLDAGNGGTTEDTGSYFLFAYWMARYFGFFQ